MSSLNRQKQWADLDNGLRISPTGNVVIKRDKEALSQSIVNILSTMKYSRPRSMIGAGVYALLFEPVTEETAEDMETAIEAAIRKHDNRISQINAHVRAFPQDNYYEVRIRFRENTELSFQEITSFLQAQR